MRNILNVLRLLCILLTLTTISEAKEWRGLVPLHSTREDVTRLLGASPDANSIRANYSFETEDVYIVFSNEESRQECARQLPKNTVLLIEVMPKKDLKLDDLQINASKFRKFDPSSPPIEYEGYINEEEGIIIRTRKGRVDEICYIATANDKKLCPEYYENPEGFIHLIIDFVRKFDEYGDISFSDEKARLDNLAIQLQNEPDAIGHIIAYAGRRARVGEAKSRADRAKTYLVGERSIEADRIITIDGGHREELTVEIWVTPRGAPSPTVYSTIGPNEVQIIDGKDKPRKRRTRGKP